MQLRHIVTSPSEHRLRAPWRLLAQLTLFAVILVGLDRLRREAGPGPGASLLVSLLYLIAVPASILALRRAVDRRRLAGRPARAC